ncbi:MAG TPA: hypothetical protein VNJ49_08360 [Bradyrhizobium sp.]|nr:hypothetical protein [Bradyrhizobium sp.]
MAGIAMVALSTELAKRAGYKIVRARRRIQEAKKTPNFARTFFRSATEVA